MLKNSCIASLVTLCMLGAARAADPVISKVERQADALVFALPTGNLTLRPLTERAVRVTFAPPNTPAPQSFVVIHHPPTPTFTVEESPAVVTLATRSLRVTADRTTGVLRFADAQGREFLQELPHSRALAPAPFPNTYSITQSFDAPASETLLGLGQFQDGVWNFRGLPVELRQLNTQIALPMLVSSRGFGLLWDNASRTDFNLPGTAIPLAAEGVAATGPTATEQLAASSLPAPTAKSREGTFTAPADGTYVFSARDADRRNELTILLDHRPIASLINMWTPRALLGTATLKAWQTVSVALRGGGPNAKLFARPLAQESTFHSDVATAMDYTVFYGPSLDGIIASYRELTGPAPLWPKWAYGLWQCRERYASDQQLADTAAEFRKREIPVDLIVQDWQYWGKHGWGSYQWDESHYPNPKGMLDTLHGLNVRFMISVWSNPHGVALDELRREKLMTGEWIDVFNPAARATRWKYINEAFFSLGTDAWWGDATEPGDPGTDLLGKSTAMGPGDQVTSAYPLFASQSLYEGQRAANADKRVVILTRSAFPGQQRYAAASWSGDINGTWDAFRRQVPAGLNFSVAGIPYWTTDCGGFFHPKDQYRSPDYNQLLARWFQFSTFSPILRTHGYQSKTEFWNYLPETQKILLAYDQFRYRLLPYTYALAWQVTSKGSTMLRPLGMDFPDDPKAWSVGNQYMFGPAFLVTPVTSPDATTQSVYLPQHAGGWYDFWTGQHLEGSTTVAAAAPLEQIPLHIPAGTILPLGPVMQHANEQANPPVELRIYPGADGDFTLYDDEGDSYRYEQGALATIPLHWDERTQTLALGQRQGTYPGMPAARTFHITFVTPAHGTGYGPAATPDVTVSYRGAPLKVQRAP